MADYAVVPAKTDPHWREVAMGKITRPWQMLALKIMMMRITNTIKSDNSSATSGRSVDEIHAFFEKNLKFAQDDLRFIFR